MTRRTDQGAAAATITEVVGPSGVGKTTLLESLARRGVVSVLTVPRIFTRSGAVWEDLARGLRALALGATASVRLAFAHRVGLNAWVRLARSCVAAEHALLCVRAIASDHFVDEGPLRQLRDRESGPGAELEAWRAFAAEMIERIAALPAQTRIIALDGPRKVHEERYRLRTEAELEERLRTGGFRNLLGLFLQSRLRPRGTSVTLGSAVEGIALATGRIAVEGFAIPPHSTPEEVAERFLRAFPPGGPGRDPLDDTRR